MFPAGSPPGKLSIKVQNGFYGIASIDGRSLTKSAPFTNLDVEPGRHELRVSNPRVGLEWVTTIDVVPGELLTVVVPAGPKGPVVPVTAPAPAPAPKPAPAPIDPSDDPWDIDQ